MVERRANLCGLKICIEVVSVGRLYTAVNQTFRDIYSLMAFVNKNQGSLPSGAGRTLFSSWLPVVHARKRFLHLVIPVAERNDDPFENPHNVQCNALTNP